MQKNVLVIYLLILRLLLVAYTLLFLEEGILLFVKANLHFHVIEKVNDNHWSQTVFSHSI